MCPEESVTEVPERSIYATNLRETTLGEIRNWISAESMSPENANRFIRKLVEACESLKVLVVYQFEADRQSASRGRCRESSLFKSSIRSRFSHVPRRYLGSLLLLVNELLN